MSSAGQLITFEGGEGAGKSTQVGLLAAHLQAHGRQTLQLREPGGTALGEQLRELLKSRATLDLAIEAEALLFAACRAQLVAEVIQPALAAGTFVLCDRFIDSTVAYQAGGRGLDRLLIDSANRLACGPLRPALTILLDLPPAHGLARASVRDHGKHDRFEVLGETFHRKVSTVYHALAAAEPERFLVLDAARDPQSLSAEIWHEVHRRFF